MKLTLKEIIEATEAKVLRAEGVNGKFALSTDTRTIKKGEIYLPLKGENFDGEEFIDKAIGAGAIGFFISEQGAVSGEQKISAKLILQVKDTLTAYLELARFCKRKIAPKVVAITGSSGKTTTKEMAFCVACEKFKTHKSELNFNNEVGLCKTILSMPENTQVLIVEMGMRGLGEIELLSKYAEPDISIITNVGTAHIGRLGSVENIAKAKCEIVKHQKKNGILIAHDDKSIKDELIHLFTYSPIHLKHFSLKDTKIVEHKIGYSKFVYKNYQYELNVEGDYNIQNSLAAIEMGLVLGMSEEEIFKGLKKYSPIEKRWEVKEIKGYKIINDSYNANPESMKASIETFLNLYQNPRLMVLGDMGELGKNEVEYHRQIGDFLIQKIAKTTDVGIITVGKLAGEINLKLKENGISSINFKDNLQTSRYILDNVKIGTTIMLKASRAMKFEEIINEVNRK